MRTVNTLTTKPEENMSEHSSLRVQEASFQTVPSLLSKTEEGTRKSQR